MCKSTKVETSKEAQQLETLEAQCDKHCSSFDEAIKRAPVRSEWLGEQTVLGLAWYRVTTASISEWMETGLSICLWLVVLSFMLATLFPNI